MTDVLHISIPEKTERIAVFGGIYSNHIALQTALIDAQNRGAERMFCLGDLGAFGPHPDQVYPLLHDHDVITLRGNYDDSLARGLNDCQCGYLDTRDNHFARLSYRYTFFNTSDENKIWLGKLPEMVRFRWGARQVLLCHGSPRKMNEFLWESTTPDQFLHKLFVDYDADVIIGTHTGLKWSRTLASGQSFINVGALGRPENDGTTRVWYTLLHNVDSELTTTFVPVEYDYERLAGEMREEALPEEFVQTILTGWWTTCLEILPAKERQRGKW